MHYEETKYGFDWGAAKITRCFSDKDKGWVTLRVETPREDLQIYVTKTGKVRVYNKKGVELLPNASVSGTHPARSNSQPPASPI
jgi:hypothetical protein